MPIFELFSQKTKKRNKQGKPDVYQYNDLPESFRIQVTYIWRTALGNNYEAYKFIKETLCRETGVFYLGNRPNVDDDVQCVNFLLSASTEQALDIIDFSFRLIDKVIRDFDDYARRNFNISQSVDNAIDELNHRFKQHNIGYEFVSGEIIRIDSQYIHSEAVKPAIYLLNEANFEGASEEFLKAHKYYREQNYKEAIAEALKAFESTLKSICQQKKWSYDPTDTSAKLIRVIFDNKLIPDYLVSHFTAVRGCLEAGLPTIRNKTSGHGQGPDIIELPEHFASYALNLAATNIVFLVNCYKNHN